MEIAERVESPLSRAVATAASSRLLADEGNLVAATAMAERAVESGAGTTLPMLPDAICVLAALRSQGGEPEEALALAEEALRISEEHGFLRGRLSAELALARIRLADAPPACVDEAARWLDRAERTADASGIRVRLPELWELRSELARRRADVPGRERALREAQRLYQEMGAPLRAERVAAGHAPGDDAYTGLE
jgi:tetratricopeptide (TPR) repeat protein